MKNIKKYISIVFVILSIFLFYSVRDRDKTRLDISYEVISLDEYNKYLSSITVHKKYSDTFCNRLSSLLDTDVYCIGDLIYINSKETYIQELNGIDVVFTEELKDVKEVMSNETENIADLLVANSVIYVKDLDIFITPQNSIVQKIKTTKNLEKTIKSIF